MRVKRGTRFTWVLPIAVIVVTTAVVSPVQSTAGTEVFFTILHTNDEHSALIPHSPAVDYHPTERDPTLGGFARLATVIQRHRDDRDEHVILVSAGDFLSGSPFAWMALTGQAPELSLMDELGYDVVILGNHEFDYGPEVLAEYLRAAGYPETGSRMVMLQGNAKPPEGHALDELGLPSTHIQEIPGSGVKLGMFSLVGYDAIAVTLNADPVAFLDPLEFAERAVDDLLEAGADIIMAVTHAGLEEDRELAARVRGINIIVGGHCHTPVTWYEGTTVIVQAGENTEYLGCLELAYDPEHEALRVLNPETGQPYLELIDDSIPAHPLIQERVEELTADLNALVSGVTDGVYTDVLEPIVRSEFVVKDQPPLKETSYGNLITDAFRWSVEKATGERVDFAFQGNGQIRGSLIPGTMPHAGEGLAFYDVVATVGLGYGPDRFPGYPLVLTYLTGEEVRRILEISPLLSDLFGNAFFLQMSGLRATYDPGRAVLLWIPLADLPIPTYRAVFSAERYTGDDPAMGDDQYVALQSGDEQLYRVVTDSHVASFIPMVGDMLPRLAVQPKDREGNPADIQDQIIYRDGRPLTAWRAVVDYAANMPTDAQGMSTVPEHYATPMGRHEQVKSIPLIVWPIALLVAIWVALLIRRRRRRARAI